MTEYDALLLEVNRRIDPVALFRRIFEALEQEEERRITLARYNESLKEQTEFRHDYGWHLTGTTSGSYIKYIYVSS